jgi:hypothetical protein
VTNAEAETPEAVADPIGTTATDENPEGTAARNGAEDPEGGFDRLAIVRRIAELRRRGVEVDEWIAEEFTQIEKQLAQLRDARLKGRQPIVWFQTARDVMDAFDRGLLKDKNEARKMFGLSPLRPKKRAQPPQLAAAQARRRARS